MGRPVEIRHVLCPTDNSEPSRRALDHALAVARWYSARLTVLHVAPPAVTLAAGLPPAAPPVVPSEPDREAARRALEAFAAPVREAGVPLEARFAEGAPVEEILRAAESGGADLLVMGTHGRSGFVAWALGSVTEKVLRRAPCPVLTVRPSEAQVAPAPLFKRILCPVDFSSCSERALEYAVSLAQEADARITLLHVLDWPLEAPRASAGFDIGDYREVLAAEARERLRVLVPDEARQWCEPAEEVAAGKPYREILRAAREGASELIVMGVHGRGPLDLALFGSTTHHVVREASCPVLVVRAREETLPTEGRSVDDEPA